MVRVWGRLFVCTFTCDRQRWELGQRVGLAWGMLFGCLVDGEGWVLAMDGMGSDLSDDENLSGSLTDIQHSNKMTGRLIRISVTFTHLRDRVWQEH